MASSYLESDPEFEEKYRLLQLRLTLLYGYQRLLYADSSHRQLRIESRIFTQGARRQTEEMDGINGIWDHLKLRLAGVFINLTARGAGWSVHDYEDTLKAGKKYILASRLYLEITGRTPADLWEETHTPKNFPVQTP